MALPGGGGGPRGDGEGTHCLQSPPLPGYLLQLPGASFSSRVQWLAGSGAQLPARQAEVGASNLGVNNGGSGCPDIGIDLLGGGEIGPAMRVRDMGPDTANLESIGRITT